MSFSAHQNYRVSGAEWPDKVPSHWAADRLKRRVKLVTRKAEAADNPVALEHIESWSGRLIETESEFEAEGIAFKAGDVLFGKLRPYLAKAHVAELAGEAVGDFHVLRPSAGTESRFLGYHLLTREVISMLDGSTYGSKMPRVGWDFMGSLVLPFPPSHEQRAIISFLDRETAKIDALIEEQQRLIALLDEKRQATISQVMSKGLDPDVPMKDSGIEWLGEVPAQWRVCRLKHVADVRGRIGFRGYTSEDLVSEGEGALTLGGTNVGANGQITLEKRTYLSWAKYEESPEIALHTDDILIGQRGTCGKAALIDENIGPATINPSLVVLKNLLANPRFLCFWINSSGVQRVFDSYLSKTAVPMLSQEQIGNIPVLLPCENEQKFIAEKLASKLARLDELSTAAVRAIMLLQERRSALISAAVTGKIDVRGLIGEQAEVA